MSYERNDLSFSAWAANALASLSNFFFPSHVSSVEDILNVCLLTQLSSCSKSEYKSRVGLSLSNVLTKFSIIIIVLFTLLWQQETVDLWCSSYVHHMHQPHSHLLMCARFNMIPDHALKYTLSSTAVLSNLVNKLYFLTTTTKWTPPGWHLDALRSGQEGTSDDQIW